jgi:hypothetical protein
MKHGMGSYVHQADSQRLAALRVVERLHKQNEAVRTAKVMNQPATVPEPDVRAKLARVELKTVGEAQAALDGLEQEMAQKKARLDPFGHNKASLADITKRQELRTMLRSMTPQQRAEKAKEAHWQSAILEMPPELSGVSPSQWQMLREQVLEVLEPEARERPGSPRLGGDHAENFGNVIDPKCGCHTHGSAHNLRRAESWRANSSPGARETCGGLLRAYATQVEALRRLRHGGSQTSGSSMCM